MLSPLSPSVPSATATSGIAASDGGGAAAPGEAAGAFGALVDAVQPAGASTGLAGGSALTAGSAGQPTQGALTPQFAELSSATQEPSGSVEGGDLAAPSFNAADALETAINPTPRQGAALPAPAESANGQPQMTDLAEPDIQVEQAPADPADLAQGEAGENLTDPELDLSQAAQPDDLQGGDEAFNVRAPADPAVKGQQAAPTAAQASAGIKSDNAASVQPLAEAQVQGAAEQGATQAKSGEALATQTRAPAGEQGDSGLPSPLFSQTMSAVASRPAVSPYPAAVQVPPQAPVVAAKPGQIGADIGVEIARAVKDGREDLLIRLDPREMGRIDVRLSFDREGVLRAVMSAESPAALDLLRRDSGDLNRALADAGVRSDGQSLRFDARSGDGAGHGGQRWNQDRNGGSNHLTDSGGDVADPHYRPLRASGQVDLIA